MCEVMPPLPIAIRAIVEAFENHASKDDDKETLSKGELRELLQKEMGPVVEHLEDPAKLDKMFEHMDVNKDQKVDYAEFISVLGIFGRICFSRMRNLVVCDVPEVAVCNIHEEAVCNMPEVAVCNMERK